jgi:rSAM/selenodomain-associated transferase 2
MISIIVPAHNENENLKKLVPLLQSMIKNSDHEVLIALSSKNTDASVSLLKNLNTNFILCTKQGRACQMNEAVARAKGSILVFLHADVIPPKTFISDIEKTITQGFEAGFFSYRFDTDSFFLKINASFTSKDGIFTGGGDQCLFIKKEQFYEIGAFDENQVLMEDFEFFGRMKKRNIRYKIIKNDLIVSARKYTQNSYLKVNLSNLLLIVLFKFGFSPNKLKYLHNKLLRTSY